MFMRKIICILTDIEGKVIISRKIPILKRLANAGAMKK